MPRTRKRYATTRDPRTGRRCKVHRLLAEQIVDRPLLPTEVVHHKDGDSTNNALENLQVLPSQAFHAHFEHHLRRQKRGMPFLFPELLTGFMQDQ